MSALILGSYRIRKMEMTVTLMYDALKVTVLLFHAELKIVQRG